MIEYVCLKALKRKWKIYPLTYMQQHDTSSVFMQADTATKPGRIYKMIAMGTPPSDDDVITKKYIEEAYEQWKMKTSV